MSRKRFPESERVRCDLTGGLEEVGLFEVIGRGYSGGRIAAEAMGGQELIRVRVSSGTEDRTSFKGHSDTLVFDLLRIR